VTEYCVATVIAALFVRQQTGNLAIERKAETKRVTLTETFSCMYFYVVGSCKTIHRLTRQFEWSGFTIGAKVSSISMCPQPREHDSPESGSAAKPAQIERS
jgi:hypothetical protein